MEVPEGFLTFAFLRQNINCICFSIEAIELDFYSHATLLYSAFYALLKHGNNTKTNGTDTMKADGVTKFCFGVLSVYCCYIC